MRLIDADALKAKLKIGTNTATHSDYCNGYCDARQADLDAIDAAPTIETEVRRGRFENIPGMNNTVFCSECLAAANKELAMKYKGCPFCLARMDGGGENG